MIDTLGPDGHYPLGKPYDFSDQGHMNVRFASVRDERKAVLLFGTLLDWFILTPTTADVFVKTIRETIAEDFGQVSYVAADSRLRVRAQRRRGVVEVILPSINNRLVGEPEFWLALVDRVAAERKKL